MRRARARVFLHAALGSVVATTVVHLCLRVIFNTHVLPVHLILPVVVCDVTSDTLVDLIHGDAIDICDLFLTEHLIPVLHEAPSVCP